MAVWIKVVFSKNDYDYQVPGIRTLVHRQVYSKGNVANKP
jgi:hypothetical protein